MSSILSIISLGVGLVALIKTTLERRAAHRLPIVDLVQERFANPRLIHMLIGLAAGTLLVLGPFGLSLGLGWVRPDFAGNIDGEIILLGCTTLFIKFVWAAVEELIFRGAILPQVSKLSSGVMGLLLSSVLFAWGHLERGGTRAPAMLSLLVFGLDGVGFGIAFLATRNLWMASLWHAAKNIWIWLLFSKSTFQLTEGFLHVTYSGPTLWVGVPNQAGLLDVVVSFAVVAVVATIYRHEIAQGLEWIKGQ